ncbi:short-chain dehydrogenase/reductase [Rhizobium leguminosarum bv. trifolii]|uniref:Short-chain dehydrogenase/reductase n=2 Tax=Rhizobium TaxID=379 RepID=A0A3E1B6B3_RHILT|nr:MULTISPECIES: oxidoreductase [Rhizobium]KPH05127.1 short-chain dehydrogenase [Rhizobium acidisoli]QAS81065.1 SDR family NAD(P)-dependent oxidoreductase [Rhizobium acidisoli]RFB86463.1 short-chain dehydrogenase/reductase [Rhizobium leguminosarum bv. trifolii]RFB86723.1 short-chain dehydrogenase/reductase [Rhizobium leguminosarum bv. trifolii]
MKTWFITGASRGFGRAVAEEAIRRGNKVAATARSVEALQDLVALSPEGVAAIQLDATNPEEIKHSVAAAQARFGRIDLLFNNAGIGYFAAVEESQEAEIRRMMEINVFGLVNVTNAFLPAMRARRSGTIINGSSVGGIRAFPAVGWYCASKFAVETISESLSQELQPLGIDIVLIEPGPFATDWAGNSAHEVPPDGEIADYGNTAGGQRASFRQNVGNEPGDPAKAAVAIVNVAHNEDKPLRLPLGNISYDGILNKLEQVRQEIPKREAVGRAADWD